MFAENTDNFEKLVQLMHQYGAKDELEAIVAARNLIGFTKFLMKVREGQEARARLRPLQAFEPGDETL
jgi:hypothetical protein